MLRRLPPIPRLLLALGLLLAAVVVARAANPDALWQIVHDRCVPNQQQHANPAPCAEVDLAGGTVLLKDLRGVAQFLLMPTAHVSGIEDPAILAPNSPNYFAAAWAGRGQTTRLLKTTPPRDALSLAINAAGSRTQNQLHIHIDCLRPDVRDQLAAAATQIGPDWAPFPGGLLGHPYQAMHIPGADLHSNPFRLLADGIPGAAEAMGRYTLVLAGATLPDGQPGFVLLANRATQANGEHASGEELQDHSCPGF